MFVATVILSTLVAAAITFSAIRKLLHQPAYVQTYVRLGVPEDKLLYLAVVLLIGAAGLMVGLLWGPIGVAAAFGVTCYFILAIAAHIRANDARNVPNALIIELAAIAALILRFATL